MFIQTMKRYILNKKITSYLHLCLRNFVQKWFTNQTKIKQQTFFILIETFCTILIVRYKKHLSNVYNKFHVECYIIKNVQKNRFVNEYIDNLMRQVLSLIMFELFIITIVHKRLNENIKKHVRKFDKHIIVENFTKNVKNLVDHYNRIDVNNNNREREKIAFQREAKSNAKQFVAFFATYSFQQQTFYSKNYNSKNYFRNQFVIQFSRNQISFFLQNFVSSQRISQYFQRIL